MRVRRAAGALLTATALVATTAQAAPPPASPRLSATVDPLLRDAATIAASTGLPLALVRHELSVQNAVGQLQELVARQWPDTFGGLWIDAKTGLVSVAFTRDAAANVASLARSFAEPALLRPVTVARSYRTLRRVQDAMRADRALAARGRLRFPGLRGVRYNLDVDVTQNRPVVVTDGHTAATVAAFRARYGDVRVEATGTGGPHSCGYGDCRHFVRSGLALDDGPWAENCSAAFTVSSGQVKLESMTAGHCASAANYQGPEYAFANGQVRNSGSVDAMTLVPQGDFKAGPWIYVSGSEPARHVTGMQTYGALAVGQWICKSGWRTGYTCGSVLSRDYSADGLVHLMLTDMCDDAGDSGAGIFNVGQAVGIIHGGNANGCPSGYRGWHTHIDNAATAMNLLVVTSDSAPFMSSITAHPQYGATSAIAVKFSKPVLCSTVNASDFTVRIQNEYSPAVTAATCTEDSNANVTLTVGFPMLNATTVSVSIPSGVMQDPGGQSVGAATRTTTVA